MTELDKGKSWLVRIAAGAVAITFAGFGLTILRQFWRNLENIPAVLIFILLLVGFYRALIWAATELPTELGQKFPITGKELRERRKIFYHWLAVQGSPVRNRKRRHLP